jgi:hypothetical protein
MDGNPPSPPFDKGGLGGFESYFLAKQESRKRRIWDPVFPNQPLDSRFRGNDEGERKRLFGKSSRPK